MSAYCNLAGMFPAQGSEVWNDKLLWQPIPVHTVPKDTDFVSSKCHLYLASVSVFSS